MMNDHKAIETIYDLAVKADRAMYENKVRSAYELIQSITAIAGEQIRLSHREEVNKIKAEISKDEVV